MFAFVRRLLEISKVLVEKCPLFKEKGCSHFECRIYPDCSMNKEHIRKKYGLKRDPSTIKG